MSNCENYVSEEDIRALKESEQHIEHVARSRNSSGSKALSVTDTIRGESVTNRTLDGLEELYQNALSNIGYQQMGDYTTGINITTRDQIVFHDGSWYMYRGEIPHVTAGATLPEDGGIWSDTNPNGSWVDVGDASLRSELQSFGGSISVTNSITTFDNIRDALNFTKLSSGKYLCISGYNEPADGGYSLFRVVDKSAQFGITTNDRQFKLQRVAGHDWLHRIIRNGQTPRVVAHRGWSSISPGEPAGDNQIVNFVPENTKEAIRFCAERGAFGIEGDTKISKDGVPVIFHGYNLSRVTKGVHTGAIESYTYDELKAMDVGSYVSAKYKDARIMNYDEWLGECKRCSIMPVAEWSAPMTEQQANDLILIIKKYYGEQHSDVFVSSTYPETLKLLRRKSAYLGLGVMGGYGATIDEGRWELAYELGNSAIHLNGKSVLNMTEVNKAKEMGLLIFTGIPNSAGRIEQCIQAGVDVIVPDFYRG